MNVAIIFLVFRNITDPDEHALPGCCIKTSSTLRLRRIKLSASRFEILLEKFMSHRLANHERKITKNICNRIHDLVKDAIAANCRNFDPDFYI